MYAMWRIAEERIQKAQDAGEFESLHGAGKPLRLEDDTWIPEECRMAYKVLHNAGFVPREVEEAKNFRHLCDCLEQGCEESLKLRQMEKLRCMLFRLQTRYGRSVLTQECEKYYDSLLGRVRLQERESCRSKVGGGGLINREKKTTR